MSTNFFEDDDAQTATAPAKTAPAPLDLEDWIAANVGRIPGWTSPSSALLWETTRSITAIGDADECAAALRYAGDLAGQLKDAEAHYRPYCEAAHKIHKKIVEKRDATCATLRAEIERLKRLALSYEAEQERQAREEARRLEAEARRKAEEERRRIEAEAQEQAERLAAEGKAAEADAVIEQAALDVEDVRVEVVIPPPAPLPPAAVTGASRRTTWKPQYGDIRALIAAAAANPDAYAQYLTWNEKAVAAAVKAQQGACRIPGVSVVEEKGLAVKASR